MAGCARFTWNWAVAQWHEGNEQKKVQSLAVLKKQFNAIKYDEFPWMKGKAFTETLMRNHSPILVKR